MGATAVDGLDPTSFAPNGLGPIWLTCGVGLTGCTGRFEEEEEEGGAKKDWAREMRFSLTPTVPWEEEDGSDSPPPPDFPI